MISVITVSVSVMISVSMVSVFPSSFSWFFLLRFVRIKEDYILFFHIMILNYFVRKGLP